MSILIDPIVTHDGSNSGNNTVPPGIAGQDWCHCVSDTSLAELTAFLDDNFATIGCSSANIRTPASGSIVTYVGMSSAERDAALQAGAIAANPKHTIANVFDRGTTSLYEPET